ncbi:MAG: hypothetical protein A3J52_03020 [Omnitrophica bacterium RIFCSPHIGHO2_02_FULL_49_9]|nr:MAG: hypothetical protein A3J52_03020 [Omnitrophica bacterium RIFCSPHIGHO2_02_FULL_49_9]
MHAEREKGTMKRVSIIVLLVFISLVFGSYGFSQSGYQLANANLGGELVIADFDTGDKPNNLGGDFGSWDKDPNDESQSSQMSFEPQDALGDELGYSLRIDYDVDSSNPAYNGVWMKLQNLDATSYNTLNFYVKGDGQKGFTRRLKIELKDPNSAQFIITGLTDQWQKFSIPFEKFRRISNWNSLSELVLVFDDINSNPKSCTIYLDQISLSNE